MRIKTTRLVAALLLCLAASAANAGPLLTYVIANNDAEGTSHFGTVDVLTGAFQQIGPNAPLGTEGLAAGPGGSLLTLAYNSDLYSIDPATGAYRLVGPTGLGDCSTPASPCGPTSTLTLGSANGRIYATDFQNRLYIVNPLTAAATLVGRTNIPALPAVPTSLNPDESINFYEEALFGSGGKLYATFDALAFDLATSSVASVLVAPALYEIDPSTGLATVVGPTDLAIGAVASLDGAQYAFNLLSGQLSSLDLATGRTTLVSDTDPAAGTIRGAGTPIPATSVPEPAIMTLTCIGLSTTLAWRRSKPRTLRRF